MACEYGRKFLSADAGSMSVSGVVWFSLFVAIAGLSSDVTNGFRLQNMMQATADASALAAVSDLPDSITAVSTAVHYAELNLPPGQYGDVLNPGDVDLGVWDASTHIFTSGATNPDAVRVKLQSTLGNGNPVLTNFLRITGWDSWDVTTYAIAQRFIPGCFTDGLVARGFVDTSSGNAYFNNFCVHGQQGVYLQSNNYFETGTSVSMPDIGLLQLPASGMVGNPGLPDALRESRLNPRMVDHVPQIIAMMLDPTSSVIPDFIDSSLPVIEVDWKFSLNDSVEGRIYHVICPSGKNFGIPSQKVVSKVIVVADCQIGVPAGAVMEDVILASKDTASNDGANIHFSSNVTLGKRDNCADGGGVQIFTTESLFISSSTTFNGFQAISAKNVTLGASDEGVKGLSVQARGNIYLSSGNSFGLCNGDDPLLMTYHYYRLVF